MAKLEISSRFFHWDSATNTFTAEASDLEHEMGRHGLSRLDHANGEWGFHMVSHVTGNRIWFRRVLEHRDAENELLWVEFQAVLANKGILHLRVFND